MNFRREKKENQVGFCVQDDYQPLMSKLMIRRISLIL